jgi:ABC-type amino acid transport substrate-binding protein
MDFMQRMRLWTLLAALAVTLAAVGIAACGSSSDNSTSSGGGGGSADLGLKTSGTMLIGSDIPYPPFEYGTAPNYTGFDVDVMNQIAKSLGVKAQFQDTSFDSIFADLASGSFDAVASASTITPERQQQVNFSDPYYSADQSLVTVPGSDIKSTKDLSGKNVAVQNGTTGFIYAQDHTDASNVQGFPQGPDVINAVKSGQVDAGIIDQPVAQDALDKTGGIVIPEIIPTGELYGIAVPKDNTALLDAINTQLKKMEKDGSLDKIYEKYFKIKAPKQVTNGTTKNPG